MNEPTRTAHEKVNGWLRTINGGTSGEAPLDERGLAAVTREDGEQLLLRVTGNGVSYYVTVLEVPREDRETWFEAALAFNLHPDAVKRGHLAFDGGADTLTYCAHVPLEGLTQEQFGDDLLEMLQAADEIRDHMLTLAGLSAEAAATPAA